MITSKQDLKKYIRRVVDEVSQVVIPAGMYAKAYTEEEAIAALSKLSEVANEAIARLAINYDKSPKAFESVAAYKAARKAYFREAYAKALSDFEKGVTEIINPK